MKLLLFIATAIVLSPAPVYSQHAPYGAETGRAIKALSADETRQYLSGAGMGYALAAELNHYPGPMHVLELADHLALTPSQRVATERLMASHKDAARAIGQRLVEAERALNELFAAGKVSEIELARNVSAVAAVQGEYRLSHLETHRRMRDLLNAEQVQRYDELRGYSAKQDSKAPHTQQHH